VVRRFEVAETVSALYRAEIELASRRDDKLLHLGREGYAYRRVTQATTGTGLMTLGREPPRPQAHSNESLSTVYVRLREEGIDVWRPVAAKRIQGDVYVIMPQVVPELDENWEFFIAVHVVCAVGAYTDGEHLTAIHRA
jgi:hypothetical protein